MGTFRQDARLGKMVPLMKTDDYNDKSVTTEKLADKAVTDKKIAPDAISTSNIKDSTITTQKLTDGSVTTDKLASESVTTEKIATGAVTSDQLQYNAVKNGHIDDDAVTTDKLFDGCVQTEKLQDHSVTMEKLADGSVVNKKIAPDAVSATKIADQAVLVSKIANEVWEKLKNEYLRLDGKTAMNGDLKMNHKAICNLSEIRGGFDMGAAISLGINNTIVKMISFGSDGNPIDNIIAKLSITGVTFPKIKVVSKGYMTEDRTNIGMLVNDGSVGLAMTDSDIDGLFQQVFQTVIG